MTNYPEISIIRKMYSDAGTPEQVIRHMQAVAAYQDALLDLLERSGVYFDRDLMRAAALLHDVCRVRKDHAHAGAEFVKGYGYPEIAEIIADHHSPASPDANPEELTMADILFYTDKRFMGGLIVSPEERFAESAKKCSTDEARAKHAALLSRTYQIHNLIQTITGTRI